MMFLNSNGASDFELIWWLINNTIFVNAISQEMPKARMHRTHGTRLKPWSHLSRSNSKVVVASAIKSPYTCHLMITYTDRHNCLEDWSVLVVSADLAWHARTDGHNEQAESVDGWVWRQSESGRMVSCNSSKTVDLCLLSFQLVCDVLQFSCCPTSSCT